jgi:tetratricopeptide (TPR) repeat protein
MNALLNACGAGYIDYINLDHPLRWGPESLEVARHLASFAHLPYTAGRGWFMVGLLEYKLGHGQEALEALNRCLSDYPDINYDYNAYGHVGPTHGMVHYLLGRVYQDLLGDREHAIASYQKALFSLFEWRWSAFDARKRLSALGGEQLPPAPWHRRIGTVGPLWLKAGREELKCWFTGRGYDLRSEIEPPEVGRAAQGVHLLAWEGRTAGMPTAEELRAYVAGGGALLVFLSDQLMLDEHDPFLATSSETFDVSLNWLLQAFGMSVAERVLEADALPLLPGNADIGLDLDRPEYEGRFSALEVPEGASLLNLRRPGHAGEDVVAAAVTVALGKVAVISFRNWFASANWVGVQPQWQFDLLQGILDWFGNAGPARRHPQDAEHWSAARGLVAAADCSAAVMELDRIDIGGASGPDARYWSACLLADRVGDRDGAVSRFREVAGADADRWLVRMANLRLGVLAVQSGDEDSAMRHLSAAAGEEPDRIWGRAWIAAGNLRLAQGRHLEAARCFRKVSNGLAHSEERFRALFGLAHALAKQQKPDAAALVCDSITVEFGNAPLPPDLDTRWPDPWERYYPSDERVPNARVADAVAAVRASL